VHGTRSAVRKYVSASRGDGGVVIPGKLSLSGPFLTIQRHHGDSPKEKPSMESVDYVASYQESSPSSVIWLRRIKLTGRREKGRK